MIVYLTLQIDHNIKRGYPIYCVSAWANKMSFIVIVKTNN